MPTFFKATTAPCTAQTPESGPYPKIPQKLLHCLKKHRPPPQSSPETRSFAVDSRPENALQLPHLLLDQILNQDLLPFTGGPLAGGGLISFSDHAAGHDPSQLFAPLYRRSPIEKPFLWLGNFHPFLFTNLPRSLNSTSQTLIPKIDQLELGIPASSSSRPSSLGSVTPRHLLAPSPEREETTMLPQEEEEEASPEGSRGHLLLAPDAAAAAACK